MPYVLHNGFRLSAWGAAHPADQDAVETFRQSFLDNPDSPHLKRFPFMKDGEEVPDVYHYAIPNVRIPIVIAIDRSIGQAIVLWPKGTQDEIPPHEMV